MAFNIKKEKVKFSLHKKQGVLCHYHCHPKTGELIKHTDHPLFTENTERVYKITLPMTDNSGRPIKNIEREKIAIELAKKFKGVTIQHSSGFWMKKGKLVGDRNIILSSARNIIDKNRAKAYSIFEQDMEWMRKLAKKVGNRLGQDAIFVEEYITQKSELIPTKGKKKVSERMIEKPNVFKEY